MLNIVQYPHPALRKKALTVKKFDNNFKKFAQHLYQTLIPEKGSPEGAGLAANQVNNLSRVFVMLMPSKKFEIVVNPYIINQSKKMLSQVISEKDRFLEGCLSIKGYYGFVDRPAKIKVRYQDPNGLSKRKTLTPPYSSYFQHELDHLNGVVFIDYVRKSKQQFYLADKKGQLQPVDFSFA